jgi:hypothetical protein
MITPNGTMVRYAGNGTKGHADGAAGQSMFFSPSGIVFGPDGNLYVADSGNCRIRMITPAGIVSTFAGTDESEAIDGPALNASFKFLTNIIFDPHGNMFVADAWASKIRKITPDGIVSTIAGSGEYGTDDGPALQASFCRPVDIAMDEHGNIYVADEKGRTIRMITTDGQVTTIAGIGYGAHQDGPGELADFSEVQGIVYRDGSLYVTDLFNDCIRKITLADDIDRVSANGVQPRDIEYGVEECAICYMTMQTTDELAYCREKCGKMLHKDCADACFRGQTYTTCPMCRARWSRRNARAVPSA